MTIKTAGTVTITADSFTVENFYLTDLEGDCREAAIREALAWVLQRTTEELAKFESNGYIEVTG